MTRMTEEQSNQWKLDNLELISWLFAQEEPHHFLADMQRAIQRFGALTPNQTAAVKKWQAGMAKREEIAKQEQEATRDAPELAEGRRTLQGEILSTKWHDGNYGMTPKMVIRLADGNKVWGTISAELENTVDDIGELVGKQVSLSATVKRSDKDPHFGFFSRPKDARIC